MASISLSPRSQVASSKHVKANVAARRRGETSMHFELFLIPIMLVAVGIGIGRVLRRRKYSKIAVFEAGDWQRVMVDEDEEDGDDEMNEQNAHYDADHPDDEVVDEEGGLLGVEEGEGGEAEETGDLLGADRDEAPSQVAGSEVSRY